MLDFGPVLAAAVGLLLAIAAYLHSRIAEIKAAAAEAAAISAAERAAKVKEIAAKVADAAKDAAAAAAAAATAAAANIAPRKIPSSGGRSPGGRKHLQPEKKEDDPGDSQRDMGGNS